MWASGPGVVSRRWVWLVGGIYGYAWLQCIGVASRCCYKEVYIDILIIIINFPYSTCINFFGQQHPYFFVI